VRHQGEASRPRASLRARAQRYVSSCRRLGRRHRAARGFVVRRHWARCTMWLVTLVFSQPAAEVPFGVTAAVWVIASASCRAGLRGSLKSRQDAGSYFSITAGMAAGSRLGLVLAVAPDSEPAGPVLWVIRGTNRRLGGMLLRLWAVLTLGRLSSTTTVCPAGAGGSTAAVQSSSATLVPRRADPVGRFRPRPGRPEPASL